MIQIQHEYAIEYDKILQVSLPLTKEEQEREEFHRLVKGMLRANSKRQYVVIRKQHILYFITLSMLLSVLHPLNYYRFWGSVKVKNSDFLLLFCGYYVSFDFSDILYN